MVESDPKPQVGDDQTIRRQCCPKCGAAGWRVLHREPSGVFFGVECIGCSTLITAELLADGPAFRHLWDSMAEERAKRRRWRPDRLRGDPDSGEFEA